MTLLVNKAAIREYLERNGVNHPVLVDNVLSGFDLAQPVYEQRLEPGAELFQYMRRPAVGRPDLRVGNWFCLRGASRDGLAIMDGLAGRELHHFRISAELVALEGVASRLSPHWVAEIGGGGGATQIYVPPRLLGHVHSIGHAHAW